MQVLATSANHATAISHGFSGGAISLGIMLPSALVGGPTRAHFDGTIAATSFHLFDTDSLTVRSRTSNVAIANAKMAAISLIAGFAGGNADAELTSDATNEASIGSDAVITVSGAVTVDAGQSADNNATATVDGDATGFVSGAILIAQSHVNGAVLAKVDGDVTSSTLTVNGHGANTADATTSSFQLGGLSFSGSGTFAQVGSAATVTAWVGSSATVRHDVSVTASSANTATAKSDAASGGLVGGFAINLPRAEVGGGTLAQFDGDVVGGTTVQISSTSSNHAKATADIFSVALGFGVAGASATAEVTDSAYTDAVVGQSSSIDAPGTAIQVSAASSNHAEAVAHGKTGSLGLSVADMIPTALVGGPTTAHFDGDITNATSLTVQSRTSNLATADAQVLAISLGVGGAGGDAECRRSPRARTTRRRSAVTP